MDKLSQDLLGAIEQHLPKMNADLIKKRFDEADKAEAELARSKELISQLRQEVEVQSANLRKHNALDNRESIVSAREEEVKLKENNLQIELLQVKLDEANKRASNVYGLVGLLVQNSQAIEMISGHGMMPTERSAYHNGGGSSYIEQHPMSNYETKTSRNEKNATPPTEPSI